MYRYDIINRISHKFGHKRYLEIGVRNPNHCFYKIDIPVKVGVDPVKTVADGAIIQTTSDEFFTSYISPDIRFDVIFIDGNHSHVQSMKDFKNSLPFLSDSPGAAIIFHDVNPPDKSMATPERPKKKGNWCGEVWKTWFKIRSSYPGLWTFCVDTDYGVGVVMKSGPGEMSQNLYRPYMEDPRWKLMEIDRRFLLNLIKPEELDAAIEKRLRSLC